MTFHSLCVMTYYGTLCSDCHLFLWPLQLCCISCTGLVNDGILSQMYAGLYIKCHYFCLILTKSTPWWETVVNKSSPHLPQYKVSWKLAWLKPSCSTWQKDTATKRQPVFSNCIANTPEKTFLCETTWNSHRLLFHVKTAVSHVNEHIKAKI